MKVKDIVHEGWGDRFRKKPEPQMLPMVHYEVVINTPGDMEKLVRELE